MIRTLALPILFTLACTACSPQESTKAYTGILKIDAGTEYAALESPSNIGGACSGWNTVEIRKPGQPGTGMTNIVCWKREGDNITLNDRAGSQQKSGPASIWSD
jgi:hypothetical protein